MVKLYIPICSNAFESTCLWHHIPRQTGNACAESVYWEFTCRVAIIGKFVRDWVVTLYSVCSDIQAKSFGSALIG